jgi:hypothetical protein
VGKRAVPQVITSPILGPEDLQLSLQRRRDDVANAGHCHNRNHLIDCGALALVPLIESGQKSMKSDAIQALHRDGLQVSLASAQSFGHTGRFCACKQAETAKPTAPAAN